MARHKASLGTLTIPTGASAKSNIVGKRELGMMTSLVVYNAAAYTGTISVQVSHKEGASVDADFGALYNNGTAVTLTAGRVEKFDVGGFEAIRLATSGNEASPRDVLAFAILDIDTERG